MPSVLIFFCYENRDGVAPPTEDEKPPPTFEQMWFNDPVEGREAQMLALKLRDGVVLRAETNRIYLERTGIVTFLLQGLKHLAKVRCPPHPSTSAMIKRI
uniref:Uncharacterized protein n=1 Tax=Physcomitrium patens TaxID=3218 RepID=A0A7I4EBS3_PHYPA